MADEECVEGLYDYSLRYKMIQDPCQNNDCLLVNY